MTNIVETHIMDCAVENDGSIVNGAVRLLMNKKPYSGTADSGAAVARPDTETILPKYWKVGHRTCGQLACAPVLQHVSLQTQSLLCDTKFARMSGRLLRWTGTLGQCYVASG